MLSRTLVAACSLAAALCLQAAAQSAAAPSPSSSQAQSSSQSQAASQAQPPASAPSQSASPAQQPTPPLQFHDLPPDPHTPTPAEAAEQRQQRILAAATRMASEQAHWGPEISTPGFSISLVEVGRAKTPQGTQISYHITGSGFPPGEKLNLVRWPLNSQAQTVMGGIVLDGKGTAVCAPSAPPAPANLSAAPAPHDAPPQPAAPPCSSGTQPDQPVQIETTAAAGEAVRVALISADHKHGAAASAVPFPIASQDKACKLQVLLGMKNAEMVLVEGSGFPPNASLKLNAVSFGDTRVLNTKTNPEGRMVVLILPGVQGHDSGDTTVSFGGVNHPPSLQPSTAPAPADPDCNPQVTFHWGKDTYKTE